MKKGKLYTANKWNQPAFNRAHLFPGGGLLAEAQAYKSANPWDFADDRGLISQYIQTDAYKQGRGGLFNMTRESNPFSKMNAGSTIGALGPVVGSLGNKFISNGYDAGGVGNGIASIGGTVGSAISTVNPLVGGIVSAASGVVGGVVNRGFGTKKNTANIGAIEQNTSSIRDAGNALANASDSSSFMSAADQMGGSLGFGTKDLVKGGWWAKGKARRQGQQYLNAENAALASQNQGMVIGATNVDNNLDNSVMSNFAAFGGPIDTNSMSAIDYGFMSDYLTQKKREAETKNKMSGMTSMPAFMHQFGDGGYSGGNAGGGGATSRWNPNAKNTFKGISDFNEAFDAAVANNMLTFWFNGLEYNTKKENNPIREANNRAVGLTRNASTRPDRDYLHQAGPFRSPLNAFPIVTDTYQKALEPVPTLKYDDSNPTDYVYGPTINQGSFLKNLFSPSYIERGKPVKARETFALGGVLQSHGGDFSDGLTIINAGESHELNPNEGVQVGVDAEGTPNLVEENETIYNDYVFSNRILADETTKQLFRLPKKKDITFADISKRLEKEIAERPSDPISKAGFEKQMQMLEEQQERQKQEMEAERAKAAFEALSPEEKTALMQQRAEQEAMAQQAAMQEAAAQQQPTPEEMAMAQQQQMMADGSEPNLGQEAPMMAYGGRVNRFAKGGLKKQLYSLLGRATDRDFKGWLEEMADEGVSYDDILEALNNDDWETLRSNEAFINALAKENRALAHSISLGNNFGTYTPDNTKATIQSIARGNWKATNGKGWRGSDDLAFQQAVKGLTDAQIDALLTEELAELMRNTESYKNTSKWLENSDNALLYLNTLLNDPATPEVAKQYARKFVQDGKWKEGFNYNYNDVFGKVRSTDPGTYWHSVVEANRGNKNTSYLINDDGTVELIEGTTDGLTPAGTYTWQDAANDNTVNYYTRAASPASSSTVASPTANNTVGTEDSNIVPRRRAEWLRYAGLLGPAVGLGMQALGIGRPDTSQLDAAIQGVGDVTPARWRPLGNYLTYRPLDIWYAQNAMNAQSRATDRLLQNSVSPSTGAGLIANGYNSQLATGNLFRQSQEYNDNLRKQVEEFNRGTDQYNSEQFGATSRFNADARNRARQANAQFKLAAAREKMDADAGWYNGIYGNLSGLFRGISDIGRENVATNWRNGLITSGAMGVADEDALVDAGIAKYKRGKKAAKGGKIKKRGLTI